MFQSFSLSGALEMPSRTLWWTRRNVFDICYRSFASTHGRPVLCYIWGDGPGPHRLASLWSTIPMTPACSSQYSAIVVSLAERPRGLCVVQYTVRDPVFWEYVSLCHDVARRVSDLQCSLLNGDFWTCFPRQRGDVGPINVNRVCDGWLHFLPKPWCRS